MAIGVAVYVAGFLAVLAYQISWRAWQAHGWKSFLPVALWPLLPVAAAIYIAGCIAVLLWTPLERRR